MGPQCCDLTFEVLGGAEPAIHRGKAQVRDLIQVTQRAKDGQAHLIAGNFRGSSRPDGILDLLGQQVQRIIIDITTLTGPPYALDDLVATKGSVTPLRFTTASTAVSTVVKRRPHSGHERRRRIA